MSHNHQWGPPEQSKFGGTWHRKCQVSGCKEISLDLSDEQEIEEVSEKEIEELWQRFMSRLAEDKGEWPEYTGPGR